MGGHFATQQIAPTGVALALSVRNDEMAAAASFNRLGGCRHGGSWQRFAFCETISSFSKVPRMSGTSAIRNALQLVPRIRLRGQTADRMPRTVGQEPEGKTQRKTRIATFRLPAESNSPKSWT